MDTVAVGSYTEQLFRKQLGSIRNYIMYTYKSVSSQNKRMSLLPQYRLGADARSIVSTDPGGTEPLLHTGRCARHPSPYPTPGHQVAGRFLFVCVQTNAANDCYSSENDFSSIAMYKLFLNVS